MENLIDILTGFLLATSALLLALGGINCLFINAFNPSGKVKLLICSLLVIMPMAYPVGALVPNHYKLLLPTDRLQDIFPPAAAGKPAIEQTDGAAPPQAPTPPSPTHPASSPSPDSLYRRIAVAGIWAPFFLFFLIRPALLSRKLKRLLGCTDRVTDPAILELLRQCKTETGLRQCPRLMAAHHIGTPMTVGLFNPAVILPARLLATEFRGGLRFTLLHELKHIKRLDNWWLLLELLVSAVYFFHPAIHWAKRINHEEREHICDRHVVRITRMPAAYADFLLHEIWNRGCHRPSSLAAPLLPKANRAATRIRCILERMKPSLYTKIADRIIVVTVCLCGLSLLLCTSTPSARVNAATPEGNRQLRSETGGDEDLPMENVSIPAGARIFDWKVIDDSNMVIRTRFYGNFKVTLATKTPGLSGNSRELGFVSEWPYELDMNSRIILSNGDECRLQKLIPYNREIRGFHEVF